MSAKQCSNTERHSRAFLDRGAASDEEHIAAALIAVLTAAAHAAEPAVAGSAWADPAYRLRIPPHPGPSAWRFSAHPH